MEVLLRALQKALLFEREMQPRFESAQLPPSSSGQFLGCFFLFFGLCIGVLVCR